MSLSGVTLHAFAFGEHLEGVPRRSLGYRLLAPAESEPWAAEVEFLARRLQAAPYPDHWPPTDLFCSVLLADGRRLIAVARYGLADHTPSRRRSGLELVGVVAPSDIDVTTAVAVYHWLGRRRLETEDLRTLGGQHPLPDIVSSVPGLPSGSDPVPILPIRLWEHGALLFAATTPSDPDHHLGLLQQGAGRGWQWLPLVGSDFPIFTYAQRGPLIAWTPHLAGVAVKLERKPVDSAAGTTNRRGFLKAGLVLAVLALLGANLWATYSLHQRLSWVTPAQPVAEPAVKPSPPSLASGDGGREPFALALHGLLQSQPTASEWSPNELRDVYRGLVTKDDRLRVSSPEGQTLVAVVSLLARRSTGQIESSIRDALAHKGYDAELIELACRRIHDRLVGKVREPP